MFWRKSKSEKRISLRRSFLRVESLESRNLLSASPWQNPIACNDLDNDGTVTASDVIAAINAINASGSGGLAGKMTAPTLAAGSSKFLDANGDGELTAADPLSVINAINAGHPDAPLKDDLPDTDQQADAIDPNIPALTLTDGFARVKAELNTADDVDVFKVVAATSSLNVALFSRASGISVTVEDSTGAAVGSATNDPAAHHPAAVNATVDVGSTYYILVSGGNKTTSEYCVQVIDNGKAPPPPPGKNDSGDGSDDHSPPPPPADSGDDDSGDAPGGSDDEGKPPLPPPPPPKPADVFAKLDTSGDGSLSLAEFSVLPPPKDATVTPADVFTKLDANSDGSLSLDEFSALKPPADDSGDKDPPPPPPGGPPQSGSGPKTPPSPDDVFQHLDANSDGAISSTEFTKFREPPGVTTALDKLFASWDTDSSSLLSLTEFDLGFASFKKS